MLNKVVVVLAATPFACACGASMPEPKQPMAEAEAAARSARELGAEALPAAKLHVKLADEQINDARDRLAAGDYVRATYLLLRARADAELALALAREQSAVAERQRVVEQSNTVLNANPQNANPQNPQPTPEGGRQ